MYTKIVSDIKSNIGKSVCIVMKGSRNKSNSFEGTISKCYNSIFTILDSDNNVRSFSYADVLTKNIIIKYK